MSLNDTSLSDAKRAAERGTLNKQRLEVIKAYFKYSPPSESQAARIARINNAAKPVMELLIRISNEKGGAPDNFLELSTTTIERMAEYVAVLYEEGVLDERVVWTIQDARMEMNRFLFRTEIWASRTPEMIGSAINAVNLMNVARGRANQIIMEKTAEEMMEALRK